MAIDGAVHFALYLDAGYGKAPMQTFLDTIELAREKRIAA